MNTALKLGPEASADVRLDSCPKSEEAGKRVYVPPVRGSTKGVSPYDPRERYGSAKSEDRRKNRKNRHTPSTRLIDIENAWKADSRPKNLRRR
jgi:hypothetical protein